MLLFEVKKQKLTRLDVIEPATDSEQYLKAKFTINDADWNGKAKTAYFRLGDVVYKALLNNNNECVVPSEVLIRSESRYSRTQGSKIFVSLVGEYGTVRITTDEVCVVLNTSGFSDAEEPKNPTESEYQQIITQYAENEAAINKAKAECESARADLVGVKNIFANAIKGNLSGAVVFADDVSPVEHNPIVKVHGKNLIPSTVYNMANWGLASGTSNNYVFPLDLLKDGSKYTVSAEILDNSIGYFYIEESANGFLTDTNHQIHMPNTSNMPYTFEKKKGHEYRLFWFDSSGHTLNDFATNIQLEEGDTATPYEPYIDSSTMTVRKCGKNLVKNNLYNMEYGGVTITKNNNQSFYVNGTATQNLYLQIDNELFLRQGRYILSGCGEGGSPDTFVLYLTNDDFYAQDVGSGATFNFDSKSLIPLRLAIYKGAVLNNVLFKPMIRLAEVEDDSFEAYNGADFTPSADGTVEGITSLSPNMTILTDTEGAIVECEYNRDINKVFESYVLTDNAKSEIVAEIEDDFGEIIDSLTEFANTYSE